MDNEYIIEGEVKPGDIKQISLSLNRLDKLKANLAAYKKQVNELGKMKVPDTAKQTLQELIKKIEAELEKVKNAESELEAKMDERSRDAPIKLHNFFQGLLKHCDNILSLYKVLNQNKKHDEMLLLYRGMKKIKADAIYGKPYEARKPKDSKKDFDWLVNIGMEAMNIPARRNNSIFATGNFRHASDYGKVYIIFPVNGFDFTWSPKERDIIIDAYILGNTPTGFTNPTKVKALQKELGHTTNKSPLTYLRELAQKISEGELDSSYKAKILDCIKINDLVDKLKSRLAFTTSELGSALLSHNEIYLKGNYYGLLATPENLKYIKKMLETKLDTDEEKDKFLKGIFGELPDERVPGEVVLTPDKKTATVRTWKGITTEVVYLDSTLYSVSKTYPTNKLTVIDSNIDVYPKEKELVIVKDKKIGLVTRVYSPDNIQVFWEGIWGPRGCDKASLTSLKTETKFYKGQVVIGILPHYTSIGGTSIFGKIFVVKDIKDKKILCNQVMPNGQLTQKTYSIHDKYLIDIQDVLAIKFFKSKYEKYNNYVPPVEEPIKKPIKKKP